MRQLRKESHGESQSSLILAEMTVGGKKKWTRVDCPLYSAHHTRSCGEWCAWYSEQPNSVPESPKERRSITLVLCKREPIGKLVEKEEENTGKGFGYADDENSL
jgi:hypothetical protein